MQDMISLISMALDKPSGISELKISKKCQKIDHFLIIGTKRNLSR